MATREPVGDLILKQLGGVECVEEGATPTVLSCGGMYIPRSPGHERVLYHIITTSNNVEPVKVVTGARPHNILFDILLRESMN